MGIMAIIKGHNTTNNNSSRNIVVNISAVPLPNSMPSFFKNIIPKALPPTVEGVIADANSHRKVTLIACRHESCLSVISLNRHESPKSRPSMNIQASIIDEIVRVSKVIKSHVPG